MNNEATTLSQQGNLTGGMIPRLRAVHQEERAQDASRFDSGAFDLGEPDAPDARARLEEVTRNATKPIPEQAGDLNQTADLLDALRRRRGEREAASYDEEPSDETGSPFAPPAPGTAGSIRIVDVPVELPSEEIPVARNTGSQPSARNTGGQPRLRKGRTAMPSWDEIVFGARPDDDLA
jgi:hypothetical protein